MKAKKAYMKKANELLSSSDTIFLPRISLSHQGGLNIEKESQSHNDVVTEVGYKVCLYIMT